MDLNEAKQMAENLIRENNLHAGGWTFRFNNRKKALGLCCYGPKTIELSKVWTIERSRREVLQTICHEIAHAFTRGDGHGPEWRAKCRELGIRPERCSSVSTEAQAKVARYAVKCQKCDAVVAYRQQRREAVVERYRSNCCRAKLAFSES